MEQKKKKKARQIGNSEKSTPFKGWLFLWGTRIIYHLRAKRTCDLVQI